MYPVGIPGVSELKLFLPDTQGGSWSGRWGLHRLCAVRGGEETLRQAGDGGPSTSWPLSVSPPGHLDTGDCSWSLAMPTITQGRGWRSCFFIPSKPCINCARGCGSVHPGFLHQTASCHCSDTAEGGHWADSGTLKSNRWPDSIHLTCLTFSTSPRFFVKIHMLLYQKLRGPLISYERPYPVDTWPPDLRSVWDISLAEGCWCVVVVRSPAVVAVGDK